MIMFLIHPGLVVRGTTRTTSPGNNKPGAKCYLMNHEANIICNEADSKSKTPKKNRKILPG